MPQMIDCEIVLLIDSDGNHSVATDLDAVREYHEEHVCELNGVEGFTVVRLTVRVPLPEPVALSVEVPAAATTAATTAAVLSVA